VDLPVELRQLRYFVAVAEELHFGRAADRLHMSQSPLSRAIRELERDLGFVLFVRTTRRVELTAAGSALLERARRALAELDLAVDDARRVAEPGHGVLAIGYAPFSRSPAMRIVEAVAAERPERELRLGEGFTPEHLRQVAAHELAAAAVLETPAATDGDRIPLMLIHGAWLSARSWENFADYFGNRGAVSAPEWPRKHGDVEHLREDAEEVAGLGLAEIVDHYEQLIRELDKPPILIGHSFGGLMVELLLDRGLGRAGVALSPAPPKGILVLPFSSLKAASPALAHPSKRRGVVTLSGDEFKYGFVNTFTPGEAAEAYQRYAVPETGRIFYEAGFANFALHPTTAVHFKNGDRAPLLIVGAGEDHTVPASVARAQFKRYEHSPAQTEYMEFEGRPHLFVVGEGWDEVAAAIDGWLDGVLEATPADGASA
jgi:DNA-binding transcriptional LysR family regulator